MNSIKYYTLEFINDFNAYHIIIKLLQIVGEDNCEGILNAIKKSCCEIAINKNGCCAIQKVIECLSANNKLILCSKLIKNVVNLALDQQGYYVINFVIGIKNSKHNKEIIKKLLNERNLEEYCKSKNFSSVIEKIIECNSYENRNSLVSYFLSSERIITSLANNQFGCSSKIIIFNIYIINTV